MKCMGDPRVFGRLKFSVYQWAIFASCHVCFSVMYVVVGCVVTSVNQSSFFLGCTEAEETVGSLHSTSTRGNSILTAAFFVCY